MCCKLPNGIVSFIGDCITNEIIFVLVCQYMYTYININLQMICDGGYRILLLRDSFITRSCNTHSTEICHWTRSSDFQSSARVCDILKLITFWDITPCSLVRRLGGVVVSVLATGPKGFGFKTRPRRWIFKGNKNPQHTFLSDGK
jgi:hypothetical protein